MTYAAIDAGQLLAAIDTARKELDRAKTTHSASLGRLDLLEGLATFVAKDKRYERPEMSVYRVVQISPEDFALIGDHVRWPERSAVETQR